MGSRNGVFDSFNDVSLPSFGWQHPKIDILVLSCEPLRLQVEHLYLKVLTFEGVTSIGTG